FGLIGGLIAARIIANFETTLEQNLILAAFIPLIVYMGDAVGTQMEACIIRDLALDAYLPFRRYFFRQLLIIGTIGILFGITIFIAASLFFRNAGIGQVLGIALTAAIISSVFTGLLIPYFASKLRLDPADASGPIATIIQDILSITIYFAVATALL
ncbi:MAG: magnesium transporter, partial [Patescibacteria group bacterium]